MLNPVLYSALCELFGNSPYEVVNAGDEGEFTTPQRKKNCRAARSRLYASVGRWGECYRFDCPECADTRGRLYVSHLSERIYKGTNPSGTFFFGHVYHCKNEGCNLTSYFRSIKLDPEKALYVSKPTAHIKYMVRPTAFPQVTFPIISDEVPEYAREYLWERGFNPVEMHNKYDVRFVPKGTVYYKNESPDIPKEEWEAVEFYEDRLLIPIIQGRRIISWQARSFKKDCTQYKYLFPVGCKKSHYLYNMDNALFSENVVIVEGVTDVWRIGPGDNAGAPRAVALFGKSLSQQQLWMMQHLWGYDGRCVILLDPEEEATMIKMGALLQEKKVFPGGVAYLKLAEGYDPAMYTREQLAVLLARAFENCR
jgi:hypothetical protein